MKRLVFVVGLCLASVHLGLLAQLSSPIEGALPGGSGPGVHSPNSPFAPLPQRQDVLP